LSANLLWSKLTCKFPFVPYSFDLVVL